MRALLAANWKMNPLTAGRAAELARGVTATARAQAGSVETALFPPFVWLSTVAGELAGEPVGLGAQDCFWETAGAYTGEVSAAMLAGWCDWVILGHSERRHLGETDQAVAAKARAALAAGLSVIVCVGEREAEFAAGRTGEVVAGQVRAALGGLKGTDAARLVMAYEPVWAIGTGRNADPAQAGRTMALAQRVGAETLDAEPARLRVLYGGSVKAGNVVSYVELPVCHGCLVGGASLDAAEFSSLIEAVARVGSPPPGAR